MSRSDSDQSVLAKYTSDHYHREPFPFIWIENAIDEKLYQELAKTFPSLEAFEKSLKNSGSWWRRRSEYRAWIKRLHEENQRVNLSYALAHRDPDLAEAWKQFLSYHTSEYFFGELIKVFEIPLRDFYPGLNFDDLKLGRRWIDKNCDVTLDALIAINTPSQTASSVDPPHTDNVEKLFAGMLYFRSPGDDGGGDLLIYRRSTTPTSSNTKWPPPQELEPVFRIPYRPNSLVLLLNSAWSVHGVSTRNPSQSPRRFVNFVTEHNKPLF